MCRFRCGSLAHTSKHLVNHFVNIVYCAAGVPLMNFSEHWIYTVRKQAATGRIGLVLPRLGVPARVGERSLDIGMSLKCLATLSLKTGSFFSWSDMAKSS